MDANLLYLYLTLLKVVQYSAFQHRQVVVDRREFVISFGDVGRMRCALDSHSTLLMLTVIVNRDHHHDDHKEKSHECESLLREILDTLHLALNASKRAARMVFPWRQIHGH